MTKEMDTGIVKYFSNQRGYGFICNNGGYDVFVHISALERAGKPATQPHAAGRSARGLSVASGDTVLDKGFGLDAGFQLVLSATWEIE